jgi:hypothetical protein
LIEKEKELLTNLSDKDRLYFDAQRLAYRKAIEDSFNDKNTWWNSLKAEKEEDLDKFPAEIIQKYVGKIIATEDTMADTGL